jgi:hypothetical protein
MFVPRIWFDEVERIGKQRCTPLGYALQLVGELVGILGLLMFLVVTIYLIYNVIANSFEWSLLWFLTFPFVLGIVGSGLVTFSWSLACRKKFHYDYERRESSWIEAGEKRTYTFIDWQAEVNRR